MLKTNFCVTEDVRNTIKDYGGKAFGGTTSGWNVSTGKWD
jgi:hypothetical protein